MMKSRPVLALPIVALSLISWPTYSLAQTSGDCGPVVDGVVGNVEISCSFLRPTLPLLHDGVHAEMAIYHFPQDKRYVELIVKYLQEYSGYRFRVYPIDVVEKSFDGRMPTSTEFRFFNKETEQAASLIAEILDFPASSPKFVEGYTTPTNYSEIWLIKE